MGTTADHLAKSVFIEKLHARGYEVLLFIDPLDEIFVQNLRLWKWVFSIISNILLTDPSTGQFHSRTLPRPVSASVTKVLHPSCYAMWCSWANTVYRVEPRGREGRAKEVD